MTTQCHVIIKFKVARLIAKGGMVIISRLIFAIIKIKCQLLIVHRHWSSKQNRKKKVENVSI